MILQVEGFYSIMAGIWKEVLPNFMSLKIVHIILLIVANVNCAEIVVERASGTTPDRLVYLYNVMIHN